MAKVTAYIDVYGKLHRDKSGQELADYKYEIERRMFAYNFSQGNVDTFLRMLDMDFCTLTRLYLKTKTKADVDARARAVETTKPVHDAVMSKIHNIDNR